MCFCYFLFVAYQDVWNIRGHFCVFFLFCFFVFFVCVYVPNGQFGCFLRGAKSMRERGQLHNTLFLSPALHPCRDKVEMHPFGIVSFASHTTTTRFFPLASPLGAVCKAIRLSRQANHEGHNCISVRPCGFTVHRNELRLQVLILNTCAFCMTAHLCLRTWIGCVAIETLTLFWEWVMCVSAQHRVCEWVSMINLCSLGVIHLKASPGSFLGVITLPFVSSRTCEWKVSSFWLWKKQHLNVQVHRKVH